MTDPWYYDRIRKRKKKGRNVEITNNPHDKFFKASFSDIDTAKDFLDNYLPSELRKRIDLGTLEAAKGSFVDQELEEYHSDLLYSVEISGKEAYLYVLIEHKSYPYKPIVFQLLKYMIRIWEKELKTEKKLPVIIPLVVYHGKKRWYISESLSGLIDGYEGLPEAIRKYIPNFEYELYDLTSHEQETIKGKVRLKLTIELMRAIMIKDKETAKKKIVETMRFIEELAEKEGSEAFIEQCLRYLLSAMPKIEYEEIVEIAKAVSEERSEQIMTIAEKLMKKGRIEGNLQGKIEGKIETVWKLMMKKFPKIPIEYHEKIKKLDETMLDIIALELLDMQKQEELDRYL